MNHIASPLSLSARAPAFSRGRTRGRVDQTELVFSFALTVTIAVLNALRAAGWNVPPWVTWSSLVFFLTAIAWLYGRQLLLWLRDETYTPPRTARYLLYILILLLSAHLYLREAAMLPYLAVGDDIRDGPLHARHFLDGMEKNPYANGDYLGFSLIASSLAIPAEYLFPRSVLSGRLTTGFIAAFSTLLFGMVCLRVFALPLALATTVCFATLPLTLSQARGDIVIIENLLFFPLAVLWLKRGFRLQGLENLRLGFVAGAAMHFQLAIGATWAMLLILVPILGLRRRKVLDWVLQVSLLAVGFFVALSPRLTQLTLYFRGISERVVEGGAGVSGGNQYLDRYLETLWGFIGHVKISVFSPPYPVPLAPYHLTALAVFCIPLAILLQLSKNRSTILPPVRITAAVLLVCFTHSAVTRDLLLGYRLFVIGPLVVFLAALTVLVLSELLAGLPSPVSALATGALSLAIVMPSVAGAHRFFHELLTADTTAAMSQSEVYLPVALARSLSSCPTAEKAACILTSDERAASVLNLLHIRQLLHYFSGMTTKYSISHLPEGGDSKSITLVSECPAPGVPTAVSRPPFGQWGDWRFYCS